MAPERVPRLPEVKLNPTRLLLHSPGTLLDQRRALFNTRALIFGVICDKDAASNRPGADTIGCGVAWIAHPAVVP